MTRTPNPSFWNRIARKYAARPISDPDAYARKLEMTRAHLRPAMRLLELGCGTGGTALAHAPHVAHVEATDLSPDMLAIARERASAAGITNVTFRETSVEALAPEAPYDMVLALSLLHLLEDPAAAIVKIHGLLEPGGLFVSSTACLAEVFPLFRLVGPPLRALGLVPYVNVFSEAQLTQMLETAGFDIEERYQPSRKDAVFLIARRT